MSDETRPEPENQEHTSIHFSRVIGLPWAVGLGALATVGLGVYTLFGESVRTGRQHVVGTYLVTLLIALPLLMTYAERGLVLPGPRGPYSFARASNHIWQRYFVGWLLLGGYSLVAALLASGAGAYALFLWEELFSRPAVHPTWFGFGAMAVALLYTYGASGRNWRSRVALIYLAAIAVMLVALRTLMVSTVSVEMSSVALFDEPLTLLQSAALMAAGYWGLFFILDLRTRIQRPVKYLARALGGTLLLGYLLGAFAGLALVLSGTVLRHPTIPLTDLAARGVSTDGLFIVLIAVSGIGITLLGLSRALLAGAYVAVDMANDGFFPERIGALLREHDESPTWVGPAAGAGLSVALIATLTLRELGLLAAFAFFLITALIHVTDLFRRTPNLPARRRLHLPYHPLFPGLVVIMSLLMTTNFGFRAWFQLGGWIGLGVLLYLGYARSGGLARRRHVVVVEDEDEEPEPLSADYDAKRYRVLVAVNDPARAAYLLEMGRRFAAPQDGELVVLKVLETGDALNAARRQEAAQDEWRYLAAVLGGIDHTNTPVRPLVRMAPDAVDGILEAVQEEAVDLLVLGGKPLQGANRQQGDVLNSLLRYARCDVVVLHEKPEQQVNQIVIASGGGPDAALGFSLMDRIYTESEQSISVVSVAANVGEKEETEAAAEDLMLPIFSLPRNGEASLTREVIHAESIPAGVAKSCDEDGFLVVGTSRGGFAEWPIYGGTAVDILQAAQQPAMLVRADEHRRYATLQRVFDVSVDVLPNLGDSRRADVISTMRTVAVPTVDFFVLIFLSAMIASLGLIQNSAAVIIGAMLVAPLMSPILAIAMGMVIGETEVVRQGTESTIKGVVLAIVVGAVVTIFSPLNEATTEILARTQPNILDLSVALASGAAAGYALSRKEVAAALPGVAIAAALVPPLCVVGYGIGVSQLGYASGALLLFVTNLVAIVFSAALVFLALGFHPPRSSRDEFLRTLRITVLSLGAILAVLGITTLLTVRDANRHARVAEVFAQPSITSVGLIDSFSIGRDGRTYVITASMVRFNGEQLSPAQYESLRTDLEEAVGGPVRVEATIVESVLTVFEDQNIERTIEEQLAEGVVAQGGQVTEMTVSPTRTGYHVIAEVQLFNGADLTADGVSALIADISEDVGAEITADLRLLYGERLEIAPTAVVD